MKISGRYVAGIIGMTLSGCSTLGIETKLQTAEHHQVPFMKNAANECYYLDEYMPNPDSLVKGRQGPLALRYYTYRAANYKEWRNQDLVLSFYSKDERCWSLFEEYLVAE